MAATRPEVRTEVVDILAAAFAATSGRSEENGGDLSSVTVHRQGAGDEQGSSSVTLGQISGTRTVRALRGGSQIPVTDEFTIPLIVEVREQVSPEAGDDLCQRIVDVIEIALFGPTKPAIDNCNLYPGADAEGPNPYRSDPPANAYLLSQAVWPVLVRLQT